MKDLLRQALQNYFENKLRKPIVVDPTEEILERIMPIVEPAFAHEPWSDIISREAQVLELEEPERDE